jgi:integrase
MTQCKTVQKDGAKDRASTIEAQTVPQGADSFNQSSDTHLQGADSFSRPKVRNKTGKDNLVRHKSGRYYARVFGKGKEVWKSLRTSHYSVAQARLAEHNNTVALLRHVFAVAVEAGVIYANPAAAIKRAQLRSKEIALPSSEKFNAMVEEMRNGHGRFSRDCADFVEGLAYSGMRKGEANALEWRDVDFTANEIVVRGDAVTGTKGGEGWRRVPMIPDARALFERMRSEREGEPLDAKVFRVRALGQFQLFQRTSPRNHRARQPEGVLVAQNHARGRAQGGVPLHFAMQAPP